MFLLSPQLQPDEEPGNWGGKPDQMQPLAGCPGRCAGLFSSQLGSWSPVRGDLGADDVLELAVAERRVSSGHTAGRGREKQIGGSKESPSCVPVAPHFEPSLGAGGEI